MKEQARVTVSSLECISLPELGIKDIVAKIDTGAYTGALHCDQIKLVKAGNNKQALKFKPINNKHAWQTAAKFRQKRVKSASGHSSERFIIPVVIELNGIIYHTEIGLTKRQDLSRQVLIGRRFLQENHILVDVSMTRLPEDQSEVL